MIAPANDTAMDDSARWRIVLNRHAGTEMQGDGASPGTGVLFNSLDHRIAQMGSPIRLPPYYPLDDRTSLRIAVTALQEADLCLLGLPRTPFDLDPLMLVRQRLHPFLPMVHLPLGEFPRGAWVYRHLWRYLRPVDTLLLSCEADLGVYRRLVERCPAKVCVLPFGIDTHAWSSSPGQRAEVRSHFGLASDDVLLACHGRICPDKHIDDVLHMFRLLRGSGLPVRLWLIGPVEDLVLAAGPPRRLDQVPQTPWLNSLARQLDTEDLMERVHLFGAFPRHTLPSLLSAADVAVHLSLNPDENFGFAPVEAMAAGLPVLASDWGGIKDTVVHGATGWRVRTSVIGPAPALDLQQAAAFAQSLVTDAGMRRRMGAAGRERANRHYSLEAWTHGLQALLGQSIERAREQARQRLAHLPVSHEWTPLGRQLVSDYSEPDPLGPFGTRPLRVPLFRHFDAYPLMREVMAPYASDAPLDDRCAAVPCGPRTAHPAVVSFGA